MAGSGTNGGEDAALNQMEQEGAEKAENDGANCVRESHPSASSAISCSKLGIMLAELVEEPGGEADG